jgi:tetratricopeptide (TPR) repeat protein
MRQFKILIVDDESPLRRTIRIMLKTLDFTIFRDAEDGNSASRKLKAERFDLIVCGWDLPLMSGQELIRFTRARAFSPSVPFLFILKEPDSAAQPCNDIGCGFLSLPLIPQVLEDEIIDLLFNNLTPSELDEHFNKAGAALAQGAFMLAHEELDKAEQIEANNPLVNYYRWLVYSNEGKVDEAEEAIKKARQSFAAIILGPRDAGIKMIEAKTLLKNGMLDEARAAFDRVLDLDPNNQNYLPEIGQAYLSVGLTEEAEKTFLRSIESNPDDVFLYNMLGMVYRKSKKYDEAISSYMKALQIDPHEGYLYYNLARAYLSAGQRPKAVNALEQALIQSPDFKEAKYLYDRLLIIMKPDNSTTEVYR